MVTGGSASLEPFLSEVLRDVTDPATSKSLLDAVRNRRTPAVAIAGSAPEPRERDFHVDSLGSGSDYVAFLDHAGIASLNLGFASGDGVYHSIYDTPAWYQQFSDGDRTYGKALTQVMTTAILRLADAPVLPFDFGSLSAQRDAMGGGDSQTTAAWKRPARTAKVDLRPISVAACAAVGGGQGI